MYTGKNQQTSIWIIYGILSNPEFIKFLHSSYVIKMKYVL